MKSQKKSLYELMKEYTDMYIMFTPINFEADCLNLKNLRKDGEMMHCESFFVKDTNNYSLEEIPDDFGETEMVQITLPSGLVLQLLRSLIERTVNTHDTDIV